MLYFLRDWYLPAQTAMLSDCCQMLSEPSLSLHHRQSFVSYTGIILDSGDSPKGQPLSLSTANVVQAAGGLFYLLTLIWHAYFQNCAENFFSPPLCPGRTFFLEPTSERLYYLSVNYGASERENVANSRVSAANSRTNRQARIALETRDSITQVYIVSQWLSVLFVVLSL